ncbi:MAG: ribonuclease Y [Clostridia bacterium]|nr:ribonuclease Y [Clostridia bacterium]
MKVLGEKLVISLVSVIVGLVVGLVILLIYARVSARKHQQKILKAQQDSYDEGYQEGSADGYEKRKLEAEAAINTAEEESRRIVLSAVKEGENKKREYLLQAKEEIRQLRVHLDREVKEKREEAQRKEARLTAKEETVDKKIDALERKEQMIRETEAAAEAKLEEAGRFYEKQQAELEKIAGLSVEQAKEILLSNLDNELTHDKAALIREYQAKIADEKTEIAREIIATAIQQCAADYVSDVTVTVVPIPNEEMKGRIIGRSGRNINAIETATGVDLVIDDTPEAVILSSFNPVRREVARLALEKLIADGRIHPGKIEEIVEKARKELDVTIRREGENATFEAGVFGLNNEIIKLLGRLKYRTSYTQSVLIHSIEVSKLSGIIAAELGCDVDLAKRAGLLHDIGKAVDFETEGTHIELGAEIARKYKENDVVINAIMSHHGDVEPTSVISVIVAAADAISAARPGARNEPLESYVKRIEKLENICNSFKGVDASKTFAIQAGREVRVMVKPDEITDDEMTILSRDIAKKIEAEMQYPGQIKVTVIRETRTTDLAK